jgi:type VI protein secretion system component Hcp
MSSALMRHLLVGTRFSNVWIEFYRNDDEDPYNTYSFSNISISSIVSKGKNESVSLTRS